MKMTYICSVSLCWALIKSLLCLQPRPPQERPKAATFLLHLVCNTKTELFFMRRNKILMYLVDQRPTQWGLGAKASNEIMRTATAGRHIHIE